MSYTGVGLDRAASFRRDGDWIAERLSRPETLIVPVWRNRNLIRGEGTLEDPDAGIPESVFLSGKGAEAVIAQAGFTVFLGLAGGSLAGGSLAGGSLAGGSLAGGAAYFAADLSDLDEDASRALAGGAIAGGARFEDLRRVGALMAGGQAAILAYARGLAFWHQRHMFCGVCGHPTESRDGGHVRFCANPEDPHMHFPRTDPAVIMLVSMDDPERGGPACLLGRQSRWPEGMYSTLAGFVEPGETLEEAVAREVREESGITVGEVVYRASQPWPFPSSLMLGFRAVAETQDIQIDARELEDAQWFTPAQVRGFGEWATAAAGEKRLPRKDSISRWLIEGWLADVEGGS